MKKISLGGVALVCAFCSLYAQDPRERNYFYEILDPKHEPKPLVEGFAQERITENLNRGLAVAPSRARDLADHGHGGRRTVPHPGICAAAGQERLSGRDARGDRPVVREGGAEARRAGHPCPAAGRGRADVHLLQHMEQPVPRRTDPPWHRRIL